MTISLEELQQHLGSERYRLLSQLGRGGMGLVFEAEDKLLGRRVAIKIALEALSAKALQRFFNECRLLAKASSPYIVQVYEWGRTASGLPFIVMELLQGTTLEDALCSGETLELEELITVISDISMALEVVHSHGLVHRDVKPSNIMLTRAEGILQAKLMDFGIVHDGKLALTRTNDILGTPLYMSPEHLNPKTLDHRSDIFSLGCILYRCLVGVVPFAADTALQTFVNLESQKGPPELPERVPSFLRSITQMCLQPNPASRFQSTQDLRQALLQRNCSPSDALTAKRFTIVPRVMIALAVVICCALFFAVSSKLLYRAEAPGPPSWRQFEQKALFFQQKGVIGEAYKWNALALKSCDRFREQGLIELRQKDLSFALGQGTQKDYDWLEANEHKFQSIREACSQVKALKAKLSDALHKPPNEVQANYRDALDFYLKSYHDDPWLIFDLRRRMLHYLCRIKSKDSDHAFRGLMASVKDTNLGAKIESYQIVDIMEPMASVNPELAARELSSILPSYKTPLARVQLLCLMHRLQQKLRTPDLAYLNEAFSKRLSVDEATRCHILLLMVETYPDRKMQYLEQALDLSKKHNLAPHCRASINSHLAYACSERKEYAKAEAHRLEALSNLRERLAQLTEEYQRDEVKVEIARFEKMGPWPR
ncbi:MAG: serine/threonine protein kinase [Candidatus Obscuribacterales bacterium]|nr:serine/threonine protein kinase [Candidatus Obscuribacterales bacterium]